jgi:rhodanese-related sulfurtransferase
MDVRRITPEEAKSLLDSGDGYVYLDSRNIPFLMRGAPNAQFVEIVARNFPKDAKLICGCQRGQRSLMAAQALLAAGFTSVVDMRGGFGGEMDHCGCMVFPGWAPRGFPTTSESNPEDRYETLKTVT